MKNRISKMAIALFAMAGISTANAELVLDVDFAKTVKTWPSNATNGDTFGWSFRVKNAISIDGLGVYDLSSNGLTKPMTVGLWEMATHTLLASAVIDSGSTRVPTLNTNTADSWLIADIAKLDLQIGEYAIGEVLSGQGEPVRSTLPSAANAQYSTISDIEVTGGVMSTGKTNSLQEPTTATSDIFFGPTMRLAGAANQVPEPNSILLIGLSLVACAKFSKSAIKKR